MAQYIALVRIEPIHVPGKGADRGDVISYRRGECETTNVIIKKNGTEVLGEILWETRKAIDIRTATGKVLLQKTDIKEIHRKLTSFEKRKCLCLKVEMTKAERLSAQKKVRPSALYVPLTQPPDPEVDPDGYKAWELACREEQDKLANWGLKVDFDAVPEIKAKLKDIDDLGKVVEPIMVANTIIKEAQAVRL